MVEKTGLPFPAPTKAAMMIIYRTHTTDPYFNLAIEDYLTATFDGTDIFMLWQNDKSVIIGKNQNAYAEVNKAFAEENGIKVVRRLTGGGAVFHDLGNVNFSFLTAAKEGTQLNYAAFCDPIIRALRKLGIDACLSGRNDILANGLKVSGNAQCVRGGCVLHHGTLLWSADFSDMQGVLNPDPEKLQSKGIRSVSSRVGNLRDIVPEGQVLGKNSTAKDLIAYLESNFDGDIREFSDEQNAAIAHLRDVQYGTWEWNWGKSPAYTVSHKKRFPYGSVCVSLNVAHGVIETAKFSGDFFGAQPVAAAEEALVGCRCEYADVFAKLSDIGACISGASPEEIAALIVG